MRILTIVRLAGASILGIGVSAQAHHSHAMFDHDREVTITGKVSDLVFTNPHVFLYVDVEDENGEVVKYWIEMSNIPNMIRRGIGARTFKAGDVVTVNMYPLRDGRPGGNYTTIVGPDGKTYD